MGTRKIAKCVSGSTAVDGAGVKLVRVLGLPTVKDFDPFLLLDAFDSDNPADYIKGFPWHPHRGIETVTWLIQGTIEHGDSLGNKGVITDGCCQWMTAGRGIIHQEMPQATKRMLGLQLWLNLPAKDKMTAPKYRDLTADRIPIAEEQGTRIAIISGTYQGQEGAMRADYVPATMLDIHIEAGHSCDIPVPEGNTVFVYIIEGSLLFSPDTREAASSARQAILLTEGDNVHLKATSSEPVRCVLCSAPPLKESISWGGPIVMNTNEELDTAFRDLDNGTFV